MKGKISARWRLAVVFAAAVAALLGGDGSIFETGSLVRSAEAVRGRPATPLSLRWRGAAHNPSRGCGRAAAATTCVQAVDAYGRVYTRC